jgi:hypothetical protein
MTEPSVLADCLNEGATNPRAGKLLPGARAIGGMLVAALIGAKPNGMERAMAGLSRLVTEFLRRARERRELAGLDETALRELSHVAKRAGTAL